MAHHYPFLIRWSGNTLSEDYSRNALVSAPKKHDVSGSSAPEFKGDTTRWNPEDLLGSALGLCHMLTFLALAHKSRIEIKNYEDQALSVLENVEKGFAVTEICLKPLITVAKGTDLVKVHELFEKAHTHCFVAKSIKSKVVMQPTLQEG